MKRWMIVIATLIISTVLGVSVVYADEVNEKSISVRFVWDDLNDNAGVRPESVAVVLKANGDKMYTKMINADTWSDTFYNLPAYIDGETIAYSIEQYMVPNAGLISEYIHVSTVYNKKENCYIITNRYREGQLVDIDSDKVQDIYVDNTVKEDMVDESESYQGNNTYNDMDYNDEKQIIETIGEKMDESPKTMDLYSIVLAINGLLMVILIGVIVYMFGIIRKI